MSVSLSAALAIHAAAAQALASTPSSMLAPYAPKGPINARALGAIAWMKNSSRMADLLALVQTCNTLEQLLGDPKNFATLVDQNNASIKTAEASPLDAAQADYRNADHAAHLAAVQRQAGISVKVDKADNERRVGGEALQKIADDARKMSHAGQLADLVKKGVEAGILKKIDSKGKPGGDTIQKGEAPSAANPTHFGVIAKAEPTPTTFGNILNPDRKGNVDPHAGRL